MKYNFFLKKLYVLVLCFLALFSGMSYASSRARVLQKKALDKVSSTTQNKKVVHAQSVPGTRWVLRTDTSFVMTDTSRGKKSKIKEEELTLTIEKRFFCINGQRIDARDITIESTNGIVSVNGVIYKGMVVIRRGRRCTFTVVGALEQAEADSGSSDSGTGEHDSLNHVMGKNLAGAGAGAGTGNAGKSTGENSGEQDTQDAPQAHHCHIKVLLDQLGDRERDQWRFKAPEGFMVWDAHYKRKMEVEHLVVTQKNQQLYINGKRCDNSQNSIGDNNTQDNNAQNSARSRADRSSTTRADNKQDSAVLAHIIPCLRSGDNAGHPTCNGKTYSGFFSLVKHKDQFYLINSVELEDYICGVLGTESLPGWPLEMQKVCAIACRTYALAMALRADRQGTFYHLKNTNAHQTYEGSHSNALMRQAVDDTRGMFMAYNGEPAIAMYDVCCGGVIPAHIRDFNCKGAPYLARKYSCTHCKPCKVYTWQTTWRLKDFEELISKKHQKISNIKSIAITKKDKAGIVREIVLQSNNKNVIISGKKLYSIMKGVKSFNFKIQKKGNRVIINGYGYGHHKGLCQWGAREMVRKGFGHEAVLSFYYPGITFARMA